MTELLTRNPPQLRRCCNTQVGIAPQKQLSHFSAAFSQKGSKIAKGAEMIKIKIKVSYSVANVILHGDVDRDRKDY